MNLTVYTREGADAGRTVEFDETVFGLEPNDHAIWLDVRAIQAHGRQGTHKTKERSEVSRSTRKLYRQKGTGGARAGSAKSPTRKGGGYHLGPRPHEYTVGVNRKTKLLARRSAIAHKLRAGTVRVVEDITFDTPKTREIVSLLSKNELNGSKVLFLTNGLQDAIYRSGRNVPKLEVRDASQANTLDLLGAAVILIQEGAIAPLTEALRPVARTSTSASEAAEA